MAKAEFLQLAHVYDSKKHFAAGKFLSEKLDGQRAFWDGGVSRGLPASEVPWANTERDARLRTPPVATGLWSRYGNVIHAPDWWLDKLPNILLDGELYCGRGQFQKLRSIVGDHTPGHGWQSVRYMAFDAPPAQVMFADRDINITNFKKRLRGCFAWWAGQAKANSTPADMVFCDRLKVIAKHLGPASEQILRLHSQTQLPMRTDEAESIVSLCLNDVTNNCGEGLILKSPFSLYKCERVYDLLKVKRLQDTEGTVVGYIAGDLPDNSRTVNGDAEGKLLGKLGALIVRVTGPKGPVEFKLSGFTDAERELTVGSSKWAMENPGKRIDGPDTGIRQPSAVFFPGSQITFRFREWSDDGYPKEARYWRKAS